MNWYFVVNIDRDFETHYYGTGDRLYRNNLK